MRFAFLALAAAALCVAASAPPGTSSSHVMLLSHQEAGPPLAANHMEPVAIGHATLEVAPFAPADTVPVLEIVQTSAESLVPESLGPTGRRSPPRTMLVSSDRWRSLREVDGVCWGGRRVVSGRSLVRTI